MENPEIWPPAPTIDRSQVSQKPHRSIWTWIGIILIIVVLAAPFLIIEFVAAFW